MLTLRKGERTTQACQKPGFSKFKSFSNFHRPSANPFRYAPCMRTITSNWNDKDSSSDFGLEISKYGLKARNLVIDKQSKMGSLLKLNDTKQIKNLALDQ